MTIPSISSSLDSNFRAKVMPTTSTLIAMITK